MDPVSLVLLALLPSATAGTPDGTVHELLRAHCIECHGPAKQKGGLRLDRRAAAARVIVAGEPEASELYQRLVTPDTEERMPKGREPLHAEEIERLRAWIAAGAEWLEEDVHWAYRPPQPPAIPAPRAASWVRSPIDAFVLERLESAGLSPQREADRRALIRRLALDLTGLPPTPEEVGAFAADPRADACERLVDRLLASPHFGERQAISWLDLARYADTHGYEKDERRSQWPWRDWVIDAFNADMPFDRFTIEQLAGDLLPGASRSQRIATGFQRNTLINQEGGTDPEEFRYAAVIDRVGTAATVWLGSTLACAQCHDHKFDPFTQRDFYRFFAFFDQTSDTGNRPEPLLPVPSAAQETRQRELGARAAALEKLLAQGDAEFAREERAWRARARAQYPAAPRWDVLQPARAAAQSKALLSVREDGSVLASGENPPGDVYEIEGEPRAGSMALLRLETLPDPSLPFGSSGRAPNGNFVLTDVRAELVTGDGRSQALALVAARADREQPGARLRADLAIDGDPASGWAAGAHQERAAHEIEFALAEPRETHAGDRLRVRLAMGTPHAQHNLGCVRISTSADEAAAARLRPAVGSWQVLGPLPGKLPAAERRGWRAAEPLARGLARELPPETTWYFREELVAPAAQRIACFLGADDELCAFLDGRPCFERASFDDPLADAQRIELELSAGVHTLEFEVVNHGGKGGFFCDCIRADLAPLWAERLLCGPERELRAGEEALLSRRYRREVSARGRELEAERLRAGRELEELAAAIPSTMVCEERAEPRRTHLHVKGSFLVEGEELAPDTPACLPPMDPAWPKNRLGLARWLTDPRHPLVARVAVNRVWEQLFGRGLVATSEDFGTRGAPPTHPALLDWLALEFVRLGWSEKQLLREIVLSATYRQAAIVDATRLELDPEDALLSRAARPRLAAELLRDNALAIAGLLDTRLGGPSVFPPQPAGVWAPVYSSDQWMESAQGERLRRGLYTFWRRSSPYATFMLFDAPSREACCARRSTSDTPLQALALLNDPAFGECARALAQRMLAAAGDERERLALGFERCTARIAEPRELETLAQLLEQERAARTPEVQAWTAVANVLLNLDETLTRP